MLRTTLDRSKCSTASYCAFFQAVGPEPGLPGVGFDQFHLLVAAAGELRVVEVCWSMKNIAAVAPIPGPC